MWSDSSEFFAHHYNNTSTVDKLFVIRNQGFIIISILNVPLDSLVKRVSNIKFILSVLRWLAITPHVRMILKTYIFYIYHWYNSQAATHVASGEAQTKQQIY